MPDGSTFNRDRWAFPVEEQPIFDQLGQEIVGNTAIVRTDTNTVLGVHGSRYTMIPHEEVVDSIVDAVRQADVGGDPKLTVHVIEEGRKLRGEILFDDLVVQPAVGDYVKFRVSFFNSYDGSWAFSQTADALRLWCLNGCTTADTAARSRFKHTQSISVEGAAAKITAGVQAFHSAPETWNHWRSIPVGDDVAAEFFSKTLAHVPARPHDPVNKSQFAMLTGLWDDEKRQLGPNKWALYNAMTYWASHTEANRNPEVARKLREDQLARTLAGKLWNAIA